MLRPFLLIFFLSLLSRVLQHSPRKWRASKGSVDLSTARAGIRVVASADSVAKGRAFLSPIGRLLQLPVMYQYLNQGASSGTEE